MTGPIKPGFTPGNVPGKTPDAAKSAPAPNAESLKPPSNVAPKPPIKAPSRPAPLNPKQVEEQQKLAAELAAAAAIAPSAPPKEALEKEKPPAKALPTNMGNITGKNNQIGSQTFVQNVHTKGGDFTVIGGRVQETSERSSPAKAKPPNVNIGNITGQNNRIGTQQFVQGVNTAGGSFSMVGNVTTSKSSSSSAEEPIKGKTFEGNVTTGNSKSYIGCTFEGGVTTGNNCDFTSCAFKKPVTSGRNCVATGCTFQEKVTMDNNCVFTGCTFLAGYTQGKNCVIH